MNIEQLISFLIGFLLTYLFIYTIEYLIIMKTKKGYKTYKKSSQVFLMLNFYKLKIDNETELRKLINYLIIIDSFAFALVLCTPLRHSFILILLYAFAVVLLVLVLYYILSVILKRKKNG